jgi:serine/threonine protein kinase
MSITDPLIGSQLGDYHIVDMLGRGGMARVYRGYDEKLDRYAAVKVIDAQLMNESEHEYRQRFLREARAIAKLNHPNIVGVYQFGEVDSLYYMAMAFVEGRDLGQILREYGQKGRLLAYRDILRIIRDIALALDHAHAGGVIHRDIKPSNIMVAVDGRAVLTDFGLALSLRDGSVGNTFGSAHYMAPEQAIASSSVVPQSDFYALGVVLYQMLVGRVPFDDPSAMAVALKHLNDVPRLPRQMIPSITPEIEAVTMRLLEKDPARRYKSGKALLRALERAFATSPELDSLPSRPGELALAVAHGNAPTKPTQAGRPAIAAVVPAQTQDRRLLLWLTLAGLLALMIGAGVFAVLTGTSPAQPTSTAAMLIGGALTQTKIASEVTAEPEATEPPELVAVPTETPTPTVTASATATKTPTATPNPTDTPEPTATPSTTPTSTLTPSPSATDTPEPRATDTSEPTVTRRPVQATVLPASMNYVELTYDGDSLVVYNPTDHTVDVSNLQFIQWVDEGTSLVFRSNVWRDADKLPAKACFQVWVDRYIDLDMPDYCQERQSWQAVSFVRWFWVSDEVTAGFDVRRGDQVLARCSILAGSCVVRLASE